MLKRSLLLSLVLSASAATSLVAQTRPRSTVTAPSLTPSPSPVQDKIAFASSWSFLPLEAARVESFLQGHPSYDGRGTIVMIFDTGVDPGIPGLLTTSEGLPKIIDVRDFSGTGDVIYSTAERSGDELKVDGKTVLKGLSSLKIKPWDGAYLYGALPEKRFQNGLSDLNFNASSDDVFGMLVVQNDPNHFMAVVDGDGDGDLSDERPISQFNENHDTFQFRPADSTVGGGRRLNGAVNFYPDRSIVSVYFDDGSHGTHVAGIAAGHDIDDQRGFNGVAPGAQIVAVKFANNNTGGVTVSGSMQRAFQLAAHLATTQSKPVVVNMSFGIGNEIEGKSHMDRWLDSLLAATPNLSVCISAGNEGPGLSSIGLPGSADRVITSGAALPADAARDLYGIYESKPVVFDFSSRGGELAKPDIISPGTAVSTVPDYVGGDRYNGTSMSSPFTTGCISLLLSAMNQEFPNEQPNAYAIKRAIMLSAAPLDGATSLDQGYGMVNVLAAYELLMRWHKKGYVPVHAVATTNGAGKLRGTPAAYYRSGVYPTGGDRATFVVQFDERTGLTDRQRSLGMESLDLVADEPWIQPVQSSVYRRGEGTVSVDVRYNPALLQKPGLYTGRIWAYDKSGPHIMSESKFELTNTVIVPYTFSDQNEYHVDIRDVKLVPGTIQRQFIAIPAGAKGVKLTLSSRDSKGGCSASLFDNEGHEFSGFSLRKGSSSRSSTLFLTGGDMPPGVWELDLSRTMASEDEKDIAVDLSIDVLPLEVNILSSGIAAGDEQMELQFTNPSRKSLSFQPNANVVGYERVIDTTITGDRFSLPFGARSGERGVTFLIEIPAEDYNLFTDVACMIIRPDSSAVANSAMDVREKFLSVNFAGSEDTTGLPYSLYVEGGLALPDRPHAWRLRIHERRLLQRDEGLSSSETSVTLVPFESETVKFTQTDPIPAAPNGYRYFGTATLRLTEENTIKLPIHY